MDENLIKLKHLRQAATQANGRISEVAETAADAIEEVATSKQDKLSGLPGQFVGFDENGNAVPQAAPSGGDTVILNAPRGAIMAWSGTDVDVPEGWHVCDGTDGTPDFRDKFLLGAGEGHELGSEGGEEEVTLAIEEMPEHYHSYSKTKYGYGASFQVGNESIGSYEGDPSNTSSTGNSQPHNNMPPYYAVLWIMHMEEPVSTGNVYAVKAPVGTIVWWSGSEDNVPTGWHICNGEDGTPDMRGVFPIGANGPADDEEATYPFGSTGGEEKVTLTVNEIPSHSHSLSTKSTSGNTAFDILQASVEPSQYTNYRTNSTGSSQPHNNIPPYLALHYIMKMTDDATSGSGGGGQFFNSFNHQIAIPQSSWESGEDWPYTATVECPGVFADESVQEIFVASASGGYKKIYDEAGVSAIAQGADSITIKADILPETDLLVYVSVVNVSESVESELVEWSPEMTSKTAPTPYQVICPDDFVDGGNAHSAFNTSNSDVSLIRYNVGFGTENPYLIFDFGKSETVYGISIGTSEADYNTDDVWVYGSVDNENWTLIQEHVPTYLRATYIYFLFDIPARWQYYKITVHPRAQYTEIRQIMFVRSIQSVEGGDV